MKRLLHSATATVYSRGILNIPALVRENLHIIDGEEVLFIKQGKSWILTTRKTLFKDALSYFKSLNPQKKPIVDEFITERHQQALTEVE